MTRQRGVVPITKNLPAERKARHRWRTLDKLAGDADRLANLGDQIRLRLNALWSQDKALARGEPLPTGSALPRIEEAKLDDWTLAQIDDCREALAVLDPDDRYDDDGDLKREHVKERLAVLVGAYPAGEPGTPAVYAQDLLEHVASIEGLTFVVLDAACRELEAEKTFRPSIAEVLKAINAQQEQWDRRMRAIDSIADLADALASNIQKLLPRIEVAAAARKEQVARRDLDSAHWHRRRAMEVVTEKEAVLKEAAEALNQARAALADCEDDVAEKTAALATAEAEAKAAGEIAS